MSDPLADIVCISAQMQEVVQLIKTAAPSKVAVLISGEAGVGKDLVARALHALSPRSSRPFIPVSCWGSADRSVEEELFGTQRISIKLAQLGNPGSLRLANTGTILLDDIDALPVPTQAKLLHLLENQNEARLDVRAIATMKHEVLGVNGIRTDLQYFLSTFHIHVPPLRERISDIAVLIDRLLIDINRGNSRAIHGVNSEVTHRFQTYPWPGNVRQMRSVLEHAALASDNNLITGRDLPRNFGQLPKAAHLPTTVSAKLSEIRFPLGATVEQVERELILQTLLRTNNNKTRAAELLGISLKTLHNKLSRYKVQPVKRTVPQSEYIPPTGVGRVPLRSNPPILPFSSLHSESRCLTQLDFVAITNNMPFALPAENLRLDRHASLPAMPLRSKNKTNERSFSNATNQQTNLLSS